MFREIRVRGVFHSVDTALFMSSISISNLRLVLLVYVDCRGRGEERLNPDVDSALSIPSITVFNIGEKREKLSPMMLSQYCS